MTIQIWRYKYNWKCVKIHKNASSDVQSIQHCQGLITNVKETHYFNIIFRVYALQSKTDLNKSIDPKVMQLNRRDRKVSFKKLFRVYVFHVTYVCYFITNVWSINICLIINCYCMFYYPFFLNISNVVFYQTWTFLKIFWLCFYTFFYFCPILVIIHSKCVMIIKMILSKHSCNHSFLL